VSQIQIRQPDVRNWLLAALLLGDFALLAGPRGAMAPCGRHQPVGRITRMPARHRYRHRRRGLAGLAAFTLGLLSWAASPPPAAAAEVATSIVSGMAWRSGASTTDAGFATWRGRLLDVRVLFAEHDTWDQLTNQVRNSSFQTACQATPLCVASLAMVPKSAAGQFAQCAGGSFDTNHRTLAGLIAGARAGAVVRLGWEANSSSGHPWRIGTAANVGPYKECFRRLAKIHKEAGLLVEWTNAKSTTFPYLDAYPGDDVVDLWGLHQFDNNTKGIVFADYVAAAASRGKKVGVAEWGLRINGDNPDYVRRMFEQFRAHAANLAYESYFNRGSEHMLYPTTRYPQSAQAYLDLWRP